MRRILRCWPHDRRQAQAGATLVELLVAVVIMGLALTIVVGTLSTGLLDATIAKRNTAAVAVVQYELDQISGGQYKSSPQPYSDCFATEDATKPPTGAAGYKGTCPSASYTLRVDVALGPPPSPNSQLWSVTVFSIAGAGKIGNPVWIIKANR
jgi:type II secretory pathway pseudopilin PulG